MVISDYFGLNVRADGVILLFFINDSNHILTMNQPLLPGVADACHVPNNNLAEVQLWRLVELFLGHAGANY